MFVMLPISSGLLSESLVRVTSVFGVGCCSGYLMVHVRVAAVAAVMSSVVNPSMCVAVVVISKGFGCSAVIKLGESLVFIQKCSKDARWASDTAPASPPPPPHSGGLWLLLWVTLASLTARAVRSAWFPC